MLILENVEGLAPIDVYPQDEINQENNFWIIAY